MKKLLTATALTLALAAPSFAANIAVVNLSKIAQGIPQSAEAQTKIKAEFEPRIKELQAIAKDFQDKEAKLKRDEALLTADQKRDAMRELEDIAADLKRKEQQLNQDSQRRQAEEGQKMIAVVQKAIGEIAKQKGYDLVIQNQAVIYAKPDADISDQVIKHMSK